MQRRCQKSFLTSKMSIDTFDGGNLKCSYEKTEFELGKESIKIAFRVNFGLSGF